MTVQEAITQTVLHSARPAKAIAEDMGLRLSLLYDIANPEISRRRLRAEEVPALVRASESPLVIDVMECRIGRVGYVLPSTSPTRGELVTLSAKNAREFGEFLSSLAAAIDDGAINASEIAGIRQQAAELIAAVCEGVEQAAALAITPPPLRRAR